MSETTTQFSGRQDRPISGETVAASLVDVDLTLGTGASKVHVLNKVNLSLARREQVGLVGPSGSGKSTLLMVVAGLERVDSGRVVIAGQDYAALDEDGLAAFRGKHIGFIFQAFHLMQTMTALENVAVPLELADEPDAFDRAADMLARVGLKDRLTHYPAQLSGGEQQRVAIARSLVVEPEILIADEPTGNLDTETGGSIADLIFSTAASLGTTLLLVTHDEELAKRCGRTVRMASGQVFEEDPSDRSAASEKPAMVAAP